MHITGGQFNIEKEIKLKKFYLTIFFSEGQKCLFSRITCPPEEAETTLSQII
jgi:hypothetical protein